MTAGERFDPLRAVAPTEVVLVTSAGCHLCDHARGALDELTDEFRLHVREVDLASDEGRQAQRRWRAPFPPMLIVDGALFGHGRLSKRKLRRHLGGAGER